MGQRCLPDTDNSINAAIRKIRQVLKDDPEQPRFVQTLTGRGYRFIAPVEEVGSPAAAQVGGTLIGKQNSHYRILQVLGGGGMGVVYKAEDLKLGRRAALKFLPSELAGDPNALDRIQREARAASALDHPNICAIYELGEHDGQPFIVMQLLEGQTLREWIESGPASSEPGRLTEIVGFGAQIADALDAAHRKGIILNDIKPANIFITYRGEAKILDLEWPSSWRPRRRGESESRNRKTPGQSGDQPDPNRRFHGDAFLPFSGTGAARRAGCADRSVFFRAGALRDGHRPQRLCRKQHDGIYDAVLRLPIVPARQLQPAIPDKLDSIITKAVEKDRALRYQTASEMRHDLQTVKAELEEEKRSASGVHRVQTGPERLSIPADGDLARMHRNQTVSSAIRWKSVRLW